MAKWNKQIGWKSLSSDSTSKSGPKLKKNNSSVSRALLFFKFPGLCRNLQTSSNRVHYFQFFSKLKINHQLFTVFKSKSKIMTWHDYLFGGLSRIQALKFIHQGQTNNDNAAVNQCTITYLETHNHAAGLSFVFSFRLLLGYWTLLTAPLCDTLLP